MQLEVCLLDIFRFPYTRPTRLRCDPYARLLEGGLVSPPSFHPHISLLTIYCYIWGTPASFFSHSYIFIAHAKVPWYIFYMINFEIQEVGPGQFEVLMDTGRGYKKSYRRIATCARESDAEDIVDALRFAYEDDRFRLG